MTDLSPDGRALFRAARADFEPNEGDRARVARQIALHTGVAAVTVLGSAGIASAGGVVHAGAASAVPSTALAIFAKGLGLGLLIGITVPTSYWVVEDAVSARSVTHWPMGVAPAVPVPRALQATPEASMLPTVAQEKPEVPAMIAAPVARAVPPVESSKVAATVGEEARLLRAANEARVQGKANRALGLLLEHERTFPSGVLSEERSAELVLTFCDLGRVTEARQQAKRFLGAAPGSALAARVRVSCINPAGDSVP